MSEPASSGVAAFSLGKLALSTSMGAGFAAIVVMLFTRPRSTIEWFQALICTMVCSVGGGAFVIVQFELLTKIKPDSVLGVMSVAGVFLACGLPGWMVIRWTFNWLNKNKDSDIEEVGQKVAAAVKGMRK
jgi:hypothetical protein